jgi:predicted MPP superfamily phosphohydrolase
MRRGEVVEAGTGRPLASVIVSDGHTVVTTDADGRFTLPVHDDAEFVHACVPATHVPSAGTWYADVRADDQPVQLVLHPRPEIGSGPVRIVQVTDLHVSVDGGERMRALLEGGVATPPGVHLTSEVDAAQLRADLDDVVGREHPDLVLATGDLADYGMHEELRAYKAVVDAVDPPVVSVPGNHDYLSCMTREAIAEFGVWWSQHGSEQDLPPEEAFAARVFRGDWRRPGSGRVPWLDVLGPPFFSFDIPCDDGIVHVVVYDAEGNQRYGNTYPQDAWLAADLAQVQPGAPVLLATHFPEPRAFFTARFASVRLLASFAGHWHANHEWRDGQATHWASATLGFGGIDHTPRGYRLVEIDVSGVRSRWCPLDGPEPPDDDAHADRRFAVSRAGRLVAHEEGTTGERWATQLGDPSTRWCFRNVAECDGVVYAGGPTGIYAVDAATGAVRWSRTDMATVDWFAGNGGLAARADVVAVAAANERIHAAVLEAADGTTRWLLAGRDIAGGAAAPLIHGELVIVAYVPGWLVAHALADGHEVWRAPLHEAWPVASPVTDGERVFVRDAAGTVTAHALADGSEVWQAAVPSAPHAARPYGRGPGGSFAPLRVVDGHVHTGAGETAVVLSAATGALLQSV